MSRWVAILFCLLFFFGCAAQSKMTKEELEDERLMEMATGVGAAMGTWDGREYGVYTSDIKTAAWDPVADALAYDVRVVWLEGGQEYPIDIVTSTQIDILSPRVGHFKVIVRACKTIDCDCSNPDDCSGWSDSTDITYATVDGQPGVWRLYYELAPPSW